MQRGASKTVTSSLEKLKTSEKSHFIMNACEGCESTCDEGDLKEEDCSCFTLVSFDPEDDIIADVLEKSNSEKHVGVNSETDFIQTPAQTENRESNIG